MVSCTVKVKITWLCLAFCDYSPWNSPDQNTREVAFPFSRGSSQPRDQTQVSCLAGGFFTGWATRKALWSEVKMLVTQLCLIFCDPHGLQPARLLCPWDSSRQENWSGLPFPSPGHLCDPGIKPWYAVLQADHLNHQGNSSCLYIWHRKQGQIRKR